MNEENIALTFIITFGILMFTVLWFGYGYPIYAMLKQEKLEVKKLELRIKIEKLRKDGKRR